MPEIRAVKIEQVKKHWFYSESLLWIRGNWCFKKLNFESLNQIFMFQTSDFGCGWKFYLKNTGIHCLKIVQVEGASSWCK